MIQKILLTKLFIFTLLQATTHLVPDEFSSIQEAINAASTSDTIIVSNGIYFENIDFLGKAIKVTSRYLVDNDSLIIGSTIIDAQEFGSVATFKSGENQESILQGFTLRNGIGNDEDPDGNGSFYTYGGGIYCEGSSPLIRDCIIKNNSANEGGGAGIFCYNASPVFQGCTITENQTDDVGGGFYARTGSSPEFYNCNFFDNTAEFGAGCYIRNTSTPILTNVIFNQNTANNSGGGIAMKDGVNLVANQVIMVNNDAEGLGGGLYINDASPEFSYCLIAENTSGAGGGAYIRDPSSVSMTNTTIANNTAGTFGNGVYLRDGASLNLLNTIIWGNGSTQIHFRSEGQDPNLSVSYSIVQNGEGGIDTNDNGDVEWGEGSMDDDPFFCPGGNYYVRENSPCIEGGINGSLIGCFASDCAALNTGPIWYVDVNGNSQNDGSLEAPFGTIATALSASQNGDTIRLSPGVYAEIIDFVDKQVVLESMAFYLDDSSLIEETFFAPGPLGGSCLTLNGSSNNNATIRGISFRGGSYPSGGGISIMNCSPTLANLIVEDNTADVGGGLYLSNSEAILKNISILGNGANIGGGVYVTGGAPTFENVFVKENIAYWGGGFYFENTQAIIDYGVIRMNSALIEGAGIYQSGGQSTVEWVSFEQNNGNDYGGAMVMNQASVYMDQITFSGNLAVVGSIFALYSSAVDIENSIFWGNYGPMIYSPESQDEASYLNISYSSVQGGEDFISSGQNIIFSNGGGIIDEDPLFCMVDDFNYSLSESSVCLTASSSLESIGAHDLAGCAALNLEVPHPEKMKVLANYPNPFNPSTVIVYSLDSPSQFSLKIFDISGRLVRVLDSGFRQSGEYSIVWDSRNAIGENVPSGVYFCSLKTGAISKTNRMILVR